MTELQSHLLTEKDRLLRFRSNCLEKHSPYHEKLYLEIKRGKVYYRLKKNNRYLGTIDNPMVRQLLTDGVLDRIINEIDERIDTIDQLLPCMRPIDIKNIENDLETVYGNFPRSVLEDLGLPDVENMPPAVGSDNPDYHPENLQYVSSSGILVRSKSELLIADTYTALRIPFFYESRIYLKDGSFITSDFKAFSPSKGRWMYHEHAGMITLPEYRNRFYKKMEDYISVNLYPQHDVLFTFDNPDGTINMQLIQILIRQFML